MLMHCDFVYASETAKFQLPFINLALVPEFGSSFALPARIGHIRAAELFLLGLPFNTKRTVDLGLVTQVVADQNLLRTATEVAQKLAAKPPGALQASNGLMKQSSASRSSHAHHRTKMTCPVTLDDTKEPYRVSLERLPNFNETASKATNYTASTGSRTSRCFNGIVKSCSQRKRERKRRRSGRFGGSRPHACRPGGDYLTPSASSAMGEVAGDRNRARDGLG